MCYFNLIIADITFNMKRLKEIHETISIVI